MKQLLCGAVLSIAGLCAAQAEPQLAPYLSESGAIVKTNLLCGDMLPQDIGRVANEVMMASVFNPLLVGFERTDDEFIAVLKAPLPAEQREAIQAHKPLFLQVTGLVSTRFNVEGRAGVCTPDFVEAASAKVVAWRADGTAAKASRFAALLKRAAKEGQP